MSVTSLQNLQNGIDLISSDSSILFSQVGNNINIITSQGSQGVTSLNTLTGANFITSTNGTIAITTPVGFPSGHNINIEVVGGGGGGGINTINNELPSAGNFTVLGAKGNTIISGTNSITVEGPNSVLSINSITPLGNDIELVAGSGISITNGPSNTITIASSGGGGGGVQTINTIVPSALGDFEIVGGSNIQINQTGLHQISIDVFGISTGIQSINNNTPGGSDFTLTAGANISLATLAAGNIEISATGGGAGVNTINSVSPLLGEFNISAGGTIAITPIANGILIEDSGIATINTTAVPDINHNFQILAGSGITVQTGTNEVTINATGGAVGIASINGSTPATSDFTLTAGTGITLATLAAGDIEISQSVPPVTEMNGIFPSAGAINIAVGAGLTVSSSGNTITLDTTGGGAGVPGFEYVGNGNITFTSSQTQPGYSDPVANYTDYVSGISPNKITTLQSSLSSNAISGGNSLTVSVNILSSLPVGYAPKYNQGGVVSGFNSTTGLPFTCVYTLTTAGLLTYFINTNQLTVPTGDVYYLNGVSLTFPIVEQYYQLLLGTASSQISGLDFPMSQPTSTLTVMLTTPAYSSAPTVVNLGVGTSNLPSVVYGATKTYEVTGSGSNYIINQYTTRTTTLVSSVNLITATSFADIYVLGMCCSSTNDSCYALCFSASQNAGLGAHYIIDVFATPSLVDLNLGIPGYGAGISPVTANSMSCSATLLCLGYVPADGISQAVMTSYNIVPNSSIGVQSFFPSYNQTINFIHIDASNNCFYKIPGGSGDQMVATDPTNFASLYTIYYTNPVGYNVTKCIGTDPYGNIIVSATNNDGVSADKLFAYTISTVSGTTVGAPTYEISGASFNGMLITGALALFP